MAISGSRLESFIFHIRHSYPCYEEKNNNHSWLRYGIFLGSRIPNPDSGDSGSGFFSGLDRKIPKIPTKIPSEKSRKSQNPVDRDLFSRNIPGIFLILGFLFPEFSLNLRDL